jgi:peptide/nickel transport system ATP-binding protein
MSAMTSATSSESAQAVLDVRDLVVSYPQGLGRPRLRAVQGVDLTVGRGETVSIVGESGSGKSTIGGAILGLNPVESGSIRLDGEEIAGATGRRRRALSARLQAVFQDPFSSLDPARTIRDSVGEPLRAEPDLTAAQVRERVDEALRRVGVDPSLADRYPASFSGGQRQRISIARALVRRPELVVCDEAVSALDVSVQAQVLNLLDELQEEAGTSYVFISHNMAVVRHISDRIVVLYRGRVMEEGPAEEVSDRPAHPYTRSLLAAVPVPDVVAQRARRAARTAATVRTEFAPEGGVGCPFAPRCPLATAACVGKDPPLIEFAPGRKAACIRLDETLAAGRQEGVALQTLDADSWRVAVGGERGAPA